MSGAEALAAEAAVAAEALLRLSCRRRKSRQWRAFSALKEGTFGESSQEASVAGTIRLSGVSTASGPRSAKRAL